jgi:diacylglycerol kinase family enzyme
VPLRLETAVETLAQEHTQPLFPGRILCRRDLNAQREEPVFFACCANLGLGAQVAHLANAGVRHRWGDRLGTLWSVWRAFTQDAAQDLALEVDGQKQIAPQVTNVSIGRTQHLASGLKIRHALAPGRSGFYLLLVSRLTTRRLVSLLWKLYSGAALPAAGDIALSYGQTIQVRPLSGPVAAECDGDPIGWCPARVDMAIDPIPLLTPPSYAA